MNRKPSSSIFLRTLVATAAAVATLTATAQTSDPVKVGLLSTLSGPGAGLGVDIRDGFQLAVKLGGGKLGGRAAEVVIADDQASPDVGRQTADRLIKRDKVDFLTGIVFSNVMLAVGAPTFQSKTFYISANAGPSQYAGEQCNPYFFSASWQNDNLHEAVEWGVAQATPQASADASPSAMSGFSCGVSRMSGISCVRASCRSQRKASTPIFPSPMRACRSLFEAKSPSESFRCKNDGASPMTSQNRSSSAVAFPGAL